MVIFHSYVSLPEGICTYLRMRVQSCTVGSKGVQIPGRNSGAAEEHYNPWVHSYSQISRDFEVS